MSGLMRAWGGITVFGLVMVVFLGLTAAYRDSGGKLQVVMSNPGAEGETNVVLATITATADVPPAYTGCHEHGSHMY